MLTHPALNPCLVNVTAAFVAPPPDADIALSIFIFSPAGSPIPLPVVNFFERICINLSDTRNTSCVAEPIAIMSCRIQTHITMRYAQVIHEDLNNPFRHPCLMALVGLLVLAYPLSRLLW